MAASLERLMWEGASDCWRRTGKAPDSAILGPTAYADMLRSLGPPRFSQPTMSVFGIAVSVSDYVPDDVALLFSGGRCVGKIDLSTPTGWALIYRAMAGLRPL